MEQIWDLSWRAWPATAIGIAGALLILRGLHRHLLMRRCLTPADGGHAIALASGLRLLISGAALIALGVAWSMQITWLLILALIIGAEELFETTMIVSALREGERAREKGKRRGAEAQRVS